MKAPFYTTTTTLCNGEVEITDDILNLPGTIKENMSHYYLGYISDEQMPTLWHMGTLTLEDGVMRGSIIHQNYGWGYLWHWGDSDGTNVALMRGALIYEDNDTKTNKVSTYSQHFVNKCTIANANSENAFRIFFGLMPIKESELTPDGTSMRGYYAGHYNQFFYKDATLTAEQIDRFVNGTYTVTLTGVQMGGGTYSVSFTGTDFDEETRICKITGISTYDQNITLYVCISYATTYGMQAYLADNNTKYASRLAPFFAADIIGNGDNIPDQTVLLAPNNMSNKSFILAQANFDATGTVIDSVQFLVGTPAYTGNLGATAMGDYSWADGLTVEDFYQHRMVDGTDTVVEKWWYSTSGIVRDKYIVAGAANSMMAQVVCPLPPSDLTKITVLSLNKIETATVSVNSPDSFTCSQTYTTAYSAAMYDVDTTDSLGIRKSENYATISAELLNWQHPGNDVTVDEFKEEDIPEWVPPTPGGDEDSMSGVDWLLNNTLPFGSTAGFVTQYVITGSQLQNFSNALWATFDNPDFWKSIGTVLSTSLSFDPSEILKFIVSLRMYPCTVPSSSTGGSDIYFGRGFVPISVGSGNVKITGDYTFSLTTGWAAVPSKFKDFRDYEPYTRITVILPFCGAIELTPSQVVGKEIRATYLIDTSNGTCSAALEVRGSKQYVIGTYGGNIAAQIQMSASNLGQILQKGVGATVGVAQTAGMILVGEAAASASAEASLAGATETGEMNKIMTTYQNKLASTYAGGVSSYIDNVKGIGNVPYSSFGQSTGFSNYLNTTPMIRIETRFYEIPTNYAHVYGYACNKTVKLDELSGKGFTVCKNVDLEGVPATQDELAILEQLLQTGVYL